MIFKEFDSKQETIKVLNRLMQHSTNDKQKALILKDLNLLKNGIEAEKQNAYYIDFYLKDSKHIIVLHDIRLEHNGRTAQIDHMLINRFGIELLESKSFKGKLFINEDGSLDVDYNGNIKSFPNPIEQSKRHADVLKQFLIANTNLGKRIELLGGFEISNTILINPETTITNQKLPKNFYRADTYISKRAEAIDNMGAFEVIKTAVKMTNIDTAKDIANLIINAHKPVEFDYENKYKVSKPNVNIEEKVQVENIKNEHIESELTKDIQNSTKQQLKEGDDCPFCNSKLVLREGKNKIPFLGCSSFPKCRFTRRVAKQKV